MPSGEIMALKKASKPIAKKPVSKNVMPKPTPKPSLAQKVSSFAGTTTGKVAIGAGVAGLAIGGAVLAKKLFKGKVRKSQAQKLRKRIRTNILKIKDMQLKRRLIKEQKKMLTVV